MIYLLEASVCLIAFYTFYFLFLRNKNFHGMNRFYLLSGLLLSLIIPALSIPVYETVVMSQSLPLTNFSNLSVPEVTVAIEKFDWMFALYVVYITTSTIFLAGTSREIIKILYSLKGAKTKRENGVVKVFMDNDLPTSSFFNYLFVPKNEAISPMEYVHELAHIEQWHSLDKLILSVLKAIFWFNPIIYFYKKSVDEIHEYLADQAVLDRNPTKDYLDFLRDKIERRYQYALINPFYSLIKNRLTMINQNVRSSRKIFLMVVPLSCLLVCLFSFDDYLTAQSPTKQNTLQSLENGRKNELSYPSNSMPTIKELLEKAYQIPSTSDCKFKSFNLLYAAKGEDIVRVINVGSTYNKESQVLLAKAKSGVKYLFDNIRLDCDDAKLEGPKQIILNVEDVPNGTGSNVVGAEKWLTINEPKTTAINENPNNESNTNFQGLMFKENSIPDFENILNLTPDIFEERKDCKCIGFNLLYAKKNEDIVRVKNNGSKFNKDSRQLLDGSVAGDQFLLDNIKLDCQTTILNAGQIIFSIIDEERTHLEYVTINDTITIYDSDTYEETVKEIERRKLKRESELLQETVVTAGEVEKFYNKNLNEKNTLLSDKTSISPILNSVNTNDEKTEYSILEDQSANENKYLLYRDTITIFDDENYEETVRVVENYAATKEEYDAYQEAHSKERYILLLNTKAELGDCGGRLYTDVSTYLKNHASQCLNENGTYTYKIYEKGKLVETSEPFTLADIK